MNDVLWWCEGGGDRAWWVIESVFLRSPDKGFWACLGDLPPDMHRRPETSLCNLMLKLRGIPRSSAILGSDSPQSNNGSRKGNSIHSRVRDLMSSNTLLPFFKATTAYTSASTDAVLHWLRCWAEEPGYTTSIRPKIMARYEEAAAAIGWLL